MNGSPVEVEGAFNLRDVGGLPVSGGGQIRSGRLFRSGTLADITEAGAVQLHALGLRTVIDLREPIEDNILPGALASAGVLRHLALPVYRGRFDFRVYQGLDALYADVVDRGADSLIEAITALSGAGALPGLVHCSAGKDRTGLVVGLLLSAVGVPDESVAADFTLTEQHFVGEARERALRRAAELGMSGQQLAVVSGAPTSVMLELLASLRAASGSPERYLVERGLSPDVLTRLRQTLVA